MINIYKQIINSKSKTFITFCFSFLLGILSASVFPLQLDNVIWYFIILFLSGFLIVFFKDKKYRFIILTLLFFVFGLFRHSIALPVNTEKNINYYNGQKYTITGYVSAEPDVRIEDIRYIFKVDDLGGKVYFKDKLYPRYQYGDRLKIDCNLLSPEPFDDFRYDMYLMNMGVVSICTNPHVEKIGDSGGNILFANIMKYKNIFAEQVNRLWHEPYASFMAGLLYGYRGGLGELQEHFNITGITHIVAISGYNISIISVLLITLFVHLWIPRKKAFWIIVFCIALFVVFAGASGSVVRAGIMGSLVLLAKYLGRRNKMGNAIAFTAVLMTLHNPFVLVWDVGFQLSFLATIGLIYLLPILEDKFKKAPNLFSIKELFLSTMSAIILTLPLILYQFGRLSIVSPIVNVLVLWLIPFVMLFGFLSVLLSFVFFPLGQVLAWISFVGLKYITSVAVWFSGLSFASMEISISIVLVFIFYGLIFGYIYKVHKKARY